MEDVTNVRETKARDIKARASDFSNSTWLTMGQTQQYVQVSRQGAVELARRAQALVIFGRVWRVHRPTLDDYLLNSARFEDGTESK